VPHSVFQGESGVKGRFWRAGMNVLAGLALKWKTTGSRSEGASSEKREDEAEVPSEAGSGHSWEVVEKGAAPPLPKPLAVSRCRAGTGSPSSRRSASHKDIVEPDWEVASLSSCDSFGSTPIGSDAGQEVRLSRAHGAASKRLAGISQKTKLELQAAMQYLGFSPLALLGDWVDSIGHEVVVVGIDAFRLSLSAQISWNSRWSKCQLNKWEAKLKIWTDEYGNWTCGNGMLDTKASCPARICWRSVDGSRTEWIRTSPPPALALLSKALAEEKLSPGVSPQKRNHALTKSLGYARRHRQISSCNRAA